MRGPSSLLVGFKVNIKIPIFLLRALKRKGSQEFKAYNSWEKFIGN